MDACGLPMLIAVDEEGGTVVRVSDKAAFGVADPGNMRSVGEWGDVTYAESEAHRIGSYLRGFGVNVDFAPDADVADGAQNTIGKRSFGDDAQVVAPLVAAQVKAFGAAGILCSAKHFPGIGGVAGDSHDMLIRTDDTLDDMRSSEFVPFQAAIDAGVPLVMVGHIACSKVTGDKAPASLSPAIMDVLREELGFQGVIITDSLEMGAIVENYTAAKASVLALQAGADLLLLPDNYNEAFQGVIDAVKDGSIPEADIDAHAQRVIAMKLGWQASTI
jgi:beta-N-acetylhexosaminidase